VIGHDNLETTTDPLHRREYPTRCRRCASTGRVVDITDAETAAAHAKTHASWDRRTRQTAGVTRQHRPSERVTRSARSQCSMMSATSATGRPVRLKICT
jgi:hypothetical protein